MKRIISIMLVMFFPLFLFAKGMIVGYSPEYRPEPTVAQLERLTHVVAFSLQVESSGNLLTTTVPSWLTKSFVDKAHENNTKVQICVGGWGRSGGFSGATSSGKTTFINNLMDFVEQYGLDGIDIDWEYPSAGEMASFGTFLQELKERLGEERILSIAVGASHEPSEFPASVYNAVDAVHLMAYDMQNAWPSHSDYNSSIQLIDKWWNYGKTVSSDFEKENLVLGVPFYGRGLGESMYSTIYASYKETAAMTDNAGGWDYNGIPTLQKKTEYCFNTEYGGIMIWEIAQDLEATHEHSLLNGIYSKNEELGGYSVGMTYPVIASAGVGGTIDPKGKVSVDSAGSKTFTFTPNEWFVVDDVIVDGQSKGARDSYTFDNVTEEHTIEVTFKKDPNAPDLYVISTKANANGNISPENSQTVAKGSALQVEITPDAGYVVDYVKIDGTDRGPIISIDFSNLSRDHSIEAYFKEAVGGDLGNYQAWHSEIEVPNGDTIHHNDTLWKYQGSATAGGWGSNMEPSVKLDYNYDPSGYGTTPWLYVGLYSGIPDTLITANVQYKSAEDASDTLVIKTEHASQGSVYKTDNETIILPSSGTSVEKTTVKKNGALLISRAGLAFVPSAAGQYKVNLYDLRGRELFASSIVAKANHTVGTGINTGSFSRGIYVMKIEGAGLTAVQRLKF